MSKRPIAYVLVACKHGNIIVNRNDYHIVDDIHGYGVGWSLFNDSSFDESEIGFTSMLLNFRHKHFGDGVVVIDGGANIGLYTVEWSKYMHGWGRVIAFEAQEFVYYALAGNIAINNCVNASAKLLALGEACGKISIPKPDYFKPSSFGSLELRKKEGNEFIGQDISYDTNDCTEVDMVSLDSLKLDRLDLIKLDIEGMELDALRGGLEQISKHKPIMFIEHFKSDIASFNQLLSELDYKVFILNMNLLAIHSSDPTLQHIKTVDNQLAISL